SEFEGELEVSIKDNLNRTPLWYACLAAVATPILILLAEKLTTASLHATSMDLGAQKPYSVFHLACRNDNREFVQWIVAAALKGIEKKYRQLISIGIDALSVACVADNTEIVKILAPAQHFLPPIQIQVINIAYSNNNLELAKVLLTQYHIINNHNDYILPQNASTTLHFMCANEEKGYEFVKAMLQSRKVNPNVRSIIFPHVTPLITACVHGNTKIVELMINLTDNNKIPNPIRFNTQTATRGQTAYMIACNNGHVDLVKLLIKHPNKFNIRECDDDGLTGPLIAIRANRLNVVQYFSRYTNLIPIFESFNFCGRILFQNTGIYELVVVSESTSMFNWLIAYFGCKLHDVSCRPESVTKKQEMLDLANSYKMDYIQACHKAQCLPEFRRIFVVELFTQVHLFCSGYRKIYKDHKKSDISRFFKITLRLPLELKMLLCANAYRDPHSFIKDEELQKELERLNSFLC